MAGRMSVPRPRGPVSRTLVDWLTGSQPVDEAAIEASVTTALDAPDVLTDDDVQLSLWLLYELHYGGFAAVADDWEWRPELLRVRGRLEAAFEDALREVTARYVSEVATAPGALPERLFDFVQHFPGPSLSGYLQRSGDADQLQEFLVHRSIYQLKEADPHTWAIPRLRGAAKVSLAEIQYDEYGSGRPARQHARMFADTMVDCGLDPAYGAYVGAVPALTLAGGNAMSMFGLHRRLRGACVGHLGALEASSSLPNRRYAAAVRRLGFGERAAAYFDEHVEADSVHEQLALREVCAGVVADDPELECDVIFGAAVCLALDGQGGADMLSSWANAATSLLPTASAVAVVA